MTIQGDPIPLSYYQSTDVVALARDLLGKSLFTLKDGDLTGGLITEVEAYAGEHDKASHAYKLRRTRRTEVMFQEGGCAYVYLCYGLYPLFNIVTATAGIPHAILIRSIEPQEGIEIMRSRRGHKKILATGPGIMTQALAITLEDSGQRLDSNTVWLEDRGLTPQEDEVIATPRIGIAYAEECAAYPWRFQLRAHLTYIKASNGQKRVSSHYA